MAIPTDGIPTPIWPSGPRTASDFHAKASTGITYESFVELVDLMVRPEDEGVPLTADRFKRIMDVLHSSVRLREWSLSPDGAFVIWTGRDKIVRVSPTQVDIELRASLRPLGAASPSSPAQFDLPKRKSWQAQTQPRQPSGTPVVFKIAGGRDAGSLFASIKHAQALLSPAIMPDSSPDEEFFKPASPEEKGLAMDALFDSPAQSAASNKAAAQEAQQAQAEFQIDKPEPDAKRDFRLDEASIQRHIKSLQGRVLTIVDATLGDKQQREAVKTLMNKEFRAELERISAKFRGEKHEA